MQLFKNCTTKKFHLFDFLMDTLRNGSVLFLMIQMKNCINYQQDILLIYFIIVKNIDNSQLIYLTHDTVKLNKEIFRREEIWFVEKNKNGISKLYSLSDQIIEYENNKRIYNRIFRPDIDFIL